MSPHAKWCLVKLQARNTERNNISIMRSECCWCSTRVHVQTRHNVIAWRGHITDRNFLSKGGHSNIYQKTFSGVFVIVLLWYVLVCFGAYLVYISCLMYEIKETDNLWGIIPKCNRSTVCIEVVHLLWKIFLVKANLLYSDHICVGQKMRSKSCIA